MNSVVIIFILIALKAFQLLNSFALTALFDANGGLKAIISIFIVVSVFSIYSFLKNKIPPKIKRNSAILVAIFLFIISEIYSYLIPVFLAGIFLYALIGMEARVFRSLAKYKNIPRIVSFIIALLPSFISYPFPRAHFLAPQLFYIVSSIFALSISFLPVIEKERKEVVGQKAPPIWAGLFFMVAAGFIYYMAFYYSTDNSSGEILPLIMAFYAGGATFVYASIDEFLWKLSKS